MFAGAMPQTPPQTYNSLQYPSLAFKFWGFHRASLKFSLATPLDYTSSFAANLKGFGRATRVFTKN